MKFSELNDKTPIEIKSQEELDYCICIFEKSKINSFALDDYHEKSDYDMFLIGFCTNKNWFTSGFSNKKELPEDYIIIKFSDFKNSNPL